MNGFRTTLNNASTAWLRQAEDPTASLGPNWGSRAMWAMGAVMVVVTTLRQFFSGFWLHPIGLLLAPTHLNDGANWGTLLVAYLIRLAVLKIGGARAVRDKLHPFAIGLFVGCSYRFDGRMPGRDDSKVRHDSRRNESNNLVKYSY